MLIGVFVFYANIDISLGFFISYITYFLKTVIIFNIFSYNFGVYICVGGTFHADIPYVKYF